MQQPALDVLQSNFVLSSKLREAGHLILVSDRPAFWPQRARDMHRTDGWGGVVDRTSMRMSIPFPTHPLRMRGVIIDSGFVQSLL